MMHTPELLNDLLLILLVSVPVAYACLKMKLPLPVGLMFTGIVIGPYGLGLIKSLDAIELLAEIGIVLLLFTIGLEFSLQKLKEIRRLVVVGGGLQVLVTIAATTAISVLFGRNLRQALFFGFLVSLSSTAIVLKTYFDRKEIDSPHGRAGTGILLFQDISIVLMMLLVPVLTGKEGGGPYAVAASLGTSIIALLLIVIVARLLVPLVLRAIVGLRNAEVFILTVILLSLGTAWITSQFGLSLALGAFIAGIMLADTEFSHQITADILPFRDVFNSLFFVSIGLLLSIPVLIEYVSTVAVLVLLLLSGKALIVWSVIRILGFPQRVAVMTALGLAQIGEFSFVLARAGRGGELLTQTDYQSFLAAAIISMALTPILIAVAPRVGLLMQRLWPGPGPEIEKDEEDIHLTSRGGLDHHVIIVGYGLNGRNLASVLRAVSVPYTVVELNPAVVKNARAEGEKINFGDSTRRELLRHAGIEEAYVLVLAISDPRGAERTLRIAKQLNPDVYVVVRTRYTSEISRLLELGADEVIPEEFETGIEIFSRVLQQYGVARQIIETQIEKVRKEGYAMLRSPSSRSQIKMANLNSALKAAATETIVIGTESIAVGKNLGELRLRSATGATVIAVIRGEETTLNPGAEYTVTPDDHLIVLGESEGLREAATILQGSNDLI